MVVSVTRYGIILDTVQFLLGVLKLLATVRYNDKTQLCYSVDEIISDSNTALDNLCDEFIGTEIPLDNLFEVYIDSLSKQFSGVICNGVKYTPFDTSGYIVFNWGALKIIQGGTAKLLVNHIRRGVVIETFI